MKLWIAALALGALAGLATADDLEDSYTKLKDAVAKKDANAVKSSAAETLKLAHAAVTAPKPAEADLEDHWKQTVEYGKEVESYTEYALAATAQAGVEPAKTVELIETLVAQNAKSKYLDDPAVTAYWSALTKTGATAKLGADMTKILAGHPDNTVALLVMVETSGSSPERALSYANKLIAAMRGKTKAEGQSEAEFEKEKNAALATGYFTAGYVYLQKQAWVDCDKDMKAAVPLLAGDNERLGIAYFGLGVCNFSLGKMTNDRTKMQAGEKYSEQSAAIKSRVQTQAYNNVASMKQALGGR